MSAMGQQRTSLAYLAMSALPPKADKQQMSRFVRLVPQADSCTAANRQFLRWITEWNADASVPISVTDIW
jgi:N12 class adenine-specific DNA methylase